MDKFGVFNIISSLMGLNKDDKGNKNDNNNVFSGIFENGDNKANTEVKKDNDTNKESTELESQPYVPLQNDMLTTMRRHDEFIKRVKNKNKL